MRWMRGLDDVYPRNVYVKAGSTHCTILPGIAVIVCFSKISAQFLCPDFCKVRRTVDSIDNYRRQHLIVMCGNKSIERTSNVETMA